MTTKVKVCQTKAMQHEIAVVLINKGTNFNNDKHTVNVHNTM